jgi:NADPH:quinone reductase-like Zn-dependent oxidoreductase
MSVEVAMGQLSYDPLGVECSGAVFKVGKNVTGLSIGDRVCAFANGASGSHSRTLGVHVARIPDDMAFEAAASIPVVYCTAYASLCDTVQLKRGKKVLIHGAAGGVG